MTGLDHYLAQQVEEHVNDEPKRDCRYCTKGCKRCCEPDDIEEEEDDE
jgi:hypothetical protein